MDNFLKKLKNFLLFKNPIYNFFLERRSVSEILFIPESLWSGDPENGKQIIGGYLNFNGESFYFKNNIWKKNQASNLWNHQLHSFVWLKDVRAVGTDKARIFGRKSILEWLNHFNKWDPNIWHPEILSKRIYFLLSNLSFFYNTADEIFQRKISKSINKQSLHLFALLERSVEKHDKIFAAKAMILSSLCFKNLRNKFDVGQKRLMNIIKTDLLPDGMHYLKSPSRHFSFLRSLIEIKNYLGSLKISIPSKLNEKINEMSSILKFFRIGNGELAIFNEYKYVSNDQLNQVIKRSNSKFKIPEILKFSGFQRVSRNKITFLMDCGVPTKENTHAGSLSFEFSFGTEKIVVNSGTPYIKNKKSSEFVRSTQAHSTISIDNYDSSNIFFGNNQNRRIANVWSKKLEDGNNFWIDSAHSGYKSLFNLIHNRKIHIDSNNSIIRGQDYFSKPLKNFSNAPKKFFLRFHIHPEIELNVTRSKKKVLLRLKNNLGWEFICSEPRVELKQGVYLGGNKLVQKNSHILISDNIIAEKKIKWLFRLIK